MSIYYDEHGNVKPPSAFTEFAGGILDSYYLKVSAAEQEVREFRDRNDRLKYDSSSMEKDRDRWKKEAESEGHRADGAEVKVRRSQGTIDTQATEIAKRDKTIEQYAAWRVAVREALNDLPERLEWFESNEGDGAASTESSSQVIAVIRRIDDLTKAIEGES